MIKKNLPLIVIMLLALILIALVIWLFDRRMNQIKSKMAVSSTTLTIRTGQGFAFTGDLKEFHF